MALKEQYMVEYAKLSASNNLTLTADTGESLLIKDIRVENAANNYIQLLTKKTTVGCFRVGGTLGNHLPFPQGLAAHTHPVGINQGTVLSGGTADVAMVDDFGNDMAIAFGHTTDTGAVTYDAAIKGVPNTALPMTLIEYLNRQGLNFTYPVAEGETFTIKEYGSNTQTADVLVVYEKYDAADKTPNDVNGSDADHYFYINYGDTGGAVTDAGDNLINTINVPAEMIDFPIGKDVPAGINMNLYGILASEAIDWDAANDYTATKYLKLMKERTVLFDDDRNGLLMYGTVPDNPAVGTYIGRGLSVVGNYSTVDSKPPLMFPSPYVFGNGEEMNAYITTVEGSSNKGSIPQAATEVGFIFEVSPTV